MLEMIRSFETADAKFGLSLQKDTGPSSTFLPYAEIYAKIAAYMEYFRDCGIAQGTRVIFPFETNEAVIVSFFALMGMGAIPLSVKPYAMGVPKESYLSFLGQISQQYRASYILDVPSIKNLEILPQRLPFPQENIQHTREPAFAKITSSDLAFVQFSSGSTSFPKGIPITHGKLTAQLQALVKFSQTRPDDIISSWLPLYHDMGLIGTFLSSLYVRHTLHLASPMQFLINPLGWLLYLSENQVSVTAIPDFAIGYCLRALRNSEPEELKNLNLEKLRIVYNGSEPINIKNLEEFIEILEPFGLRRSAIKPCYGMAEAVLMVSCSGLEDSPRTHTAENGCKAISVGKPLPEFTVRLRTEDGRLCGEDEIGEIELQGGTLAGEYFEDGRSFYNSDGFFPTGDLGFMNRGELFITGRLNNRIKINGQSYFLNDFEHAVESLPFIRPGKTAAIQARDQILVLVEVKPAQILKQSLDPQRQVSEVILNQVGVKIPPENVLFIRPGQLYKTSSGKLRRNAIAEAYTSGKILLSTAKE